MAKQFSIGDYLKDINFEKKNILRQDEQAIKDFQPFLIRRNLSNFLDAILFVQELNKRPSMEKQLQYDYLLNSLRARKRFAKTHRQEKEEEIEYVKSFYGYNDERAYEALELLSKDDVDIIKTYFIKGGK